MGRRVGQMPPERVFSSRSIDPLRLHCSCLDVDKVKLQFDHFDVDRSGVPC